MLTQHKLLIEKYIQVSEQDIGSNISNALNNVNDLVKKNSSTIEGKDLAAGFNQLLLVLLNSSDSNIVKTATALLNGAPQVAKEEDEFLVSPHGDVEKGSGGVGF